MGSTTGNTHCSMISIHSRQRSRTLSRIECCNHWRNQTHQDYSRGVLGTLDLSTATLWIEFYLIQREKWVNQHKTNQIRIPSEYEKFSLCEIVFYDVWCVIVMSHMSHEYRYEISWSIEAYFHLLIIILRNIQRHPDITWGNTPLLCFVKCQNK